jgi:hypothetical protein
MKLGRLNGHRAKTPESSAASSLLHQIVDPWYLALSDPRGSQSKVLKTLLAGYLRTRYGTEHAAAAVDGIDDYRFHFPVSNYHTLYPYIAMVKLGEDSALLPEPVKWWVMTRGTTGVSKVLPTGETHLSQILGFGARCAVNFALSRDPEVLETTVLNLNFPSRVHQMESTRGIEDYGYSSGTYAKLNPEFEGARLLPKQEEIDSLGGGIAREDWERRFELAYQSARGEDVGSLMGVTPVMVTFANYLRRKHGIRPRELWRPRALFCTSVAKIHTRYEPVLQHLYGPCPVVEMYTATEGVFAQQRDELPYVSPNYDGYLFEVITGRGTKMLHELKPNEWGRLVVSTSMLPRYDIGDLVEAMGKGYFRVFGRNGMLTRAEHRLFNLVALRF